MAESTLSFSIETEVTPAYYDELIKYTYENYVARMGKNLTNINQTVENGNYVLGFTVQDLDGKWHVTVVMKTGKPIQVTMQPSDATVPSAVLDRIKEDLIIVIQFLKRL